MKLRLIDAPLAIPRYREVRLPTVAAELAPYAEVEINDANIEPVDFSAVDAVGLTAQVYNAPWAADLSRRFRERGIATILGGPHATAVPDWALEHFDAVVVGEVEGLGGRIIGDLERGVLKGVYRNEQPPDLATMRLPRRDLQKAGRYYYLNYPIELSRGCPHACSFCFNRYQFPSFRVRPLEQIARDLASWDHGMIEVVDLHMAADKKHLLEVCRLFEEAGVLGWYGECTLGSLDDAELLEALARSNCKQVFVGLESIDPQALRSVAKGFNPHRKYREIIGKIQDHGIFVHAGLIWGLDGAAPESFEATAAFCEEAGLYLASTNLLTFFPGTRSYEEMKESGRLASEDPRAFDGAHVVVEPRGMSPGEVYAGARRFLDRFYSLGSIYRRSFQRPNYRLAHLIDYWAFNLLYRAYYKRWAARLGSSRPGRPAAGAAGGEGFPYLGGRMSPLYGLLDRSWRFWEWGYRWWRTPARGASAPATFALLTILAVTSALAAWGLSLQMPAHWPLAWPAPWQVAAAFVPASLVSSLALQRLARCRVGPFLGPAGLLLALTPLAACLWLVPSHASLWRFTLALLTLIFALKAWSLIATGRPEDKTVPRALLFLFYFPTLDFEGSFRLLPEKKQLIRHFPLQVWGFWKFLMGTALLGALAAGALRGYDEGALAGAAFDLGRLLVLYLCLSGLLDWLAAYWRMAGYQVPRGFRRPFALGGPAALWRGWNLPLRHWLLRHVYVPLGGSARPVRAVLGTFLVSGLLFELTLGAANREVTGGVLLFFAVQGVAVALDKLAIEKKDAGPHPGGWGLLEFAWAAALFFATAPWFFNVTDRIFQ